MNLIAKSQFFLCIFHLMNICFAVEFLNNNEKEEQQLIEKLLKNYNRKLRPPGATQVKFSLNLNQIITLIEKDQIIVINAFIDHEWIDKRLIWNPADHGNITVVRISGDQIWTPDTFVYTTADQSGFLLPQSGAYFIVRSEGLIFWPNPLTQMRVRCRMTILWFPFDEQLCVIVFGSWSFTFNYVNYTLMNENPNLDSYTEHNEWILMGYKPFRYEMKYDNWIENDSFSEIRYKILIRRKPLFVLQNCVIPALMLCSLTLTSFFIPFGPEMQIGISIMLSFSVFKLRLSDDVPVQSDSIPLINIYFTLCMTFSLTAMIWFSIMNLMRENKRVPKCIRYLVLNYICYLVCFKKYYKMDSKSDDKNATSSNNKLECYNKATPAIGDADLKSNTFPLKGQKPNKQELKLITYSPCNSLKSSPSNKQIANYVSLKKSNDCANDGEQRDGSLKRVKISSNSNEYLNKKKIKSEKTKYKIKFEYENEKNKNYAHPIKLPVYNNIYIDGNGSNSENLIWIPQKRNSKSSDPTSSTKIYMQNNPFDIKRKDTRRDVSVDSTASSSPTGTRIPLYFDKTESKNDPKKLEIKLNLNNNINNTINTGDTSSKKDGKTASADEMSTIKKSITDLEIIKILNKFVFCCFLFFIVSLNLFGLFIFPYFIRKPLSIND